jgi:hypothetical protein
MAVNEKLEKFHSIHVTNSALFFFRAYYTELVSHVSHAGGLSILPPCQAAQAAQRTQQLTTYTLM